jgi:hypothetical protein
MENQTTRKQIERSDDKRFNRRLRFSMAVLAAQLLLIGTAAAWCAHMALIQIYGEVSFVEPNTAILWAEIIGTAMIIVYSATVFTLQWKRLGERRMNDRVGRRGEDDREGDNSRK